MPKLLVSVRSAEEARITLAEQVQIIDVKEPHRGSLGPADYAVVQDIATIVDGQAELSVALGELIDLQPDHCDQRHVDCNFFKLGFASAERIDWRRRARDAVAQLGIRRSQFVAVAYADYERAGAPHPVDIAAEASDANWGGLLIDTCQKDGSWLGDWLSDEHLKQLGRQCRRHGILFALAGSITRKRIADIVEFDPDIVGVRGAVCARRDRNAQVESQKIQQLVERFAGQLGDDNFIHTERNQLSGRTS